MTALCDGRGHERDDVIDYRGCRFCVACTMVTEVAT